MVDFSLGALWSSILPLFRECSTRGVRLIAAPRRRTAETYYWRRQEEEEWIITGRDSWWWLGQKSFSFFPFLSFSFSFFFFNSSLCRNGLVGSDSDSDGEAVRLGTCG